jgi:deazaflavin-dependent oxidoreductase (nitroreductase family)
MPSSSSVSDGAAAYAASASNWVAEQVELYERTDGAEGGTFRGYPVIVVTMTGARTGLVRKVPLMRVHEDGKYAVLAANGGDPVHPAWYRNILSSPTVRVQDRDRVLTVGARELAGPERSTWWAKAVATYPLYEEYQAETSRLIPVILLEPYEEVPA